MEYDFDRMAEEFSKMREAYLDYRKGGSKHASEQKLNRFIALSDRFFRTYPNPFVGHDPLFIPPSRSHDSRSQHKALYFKYKRLESLRDSLCIKLDNLKPDDPSTPKFQGYLEECERKIESVRKRISSLEESRLPG